MIYKDIETTISNIDSTLCKSMKKGKQCTNILTSKYQTFSKKSNSKSFLYIHATAPLLIIYIQKQLNTLCIFMNKLVQNMFTYKAPGAFSHDLSAPSISVVEGLPSFSRAFDKSSVKLSRPLSAFKVCSSSWSSKK